MASSATSARLTGSSPQSNEKSTDDSGSGPGSPTLADAWGLGAALIVSAIVLYAYHDQFWYPRDDGYFAHIAERILNGEVLHRDIHALHPGYIYFLNALALKLFGLDLVSLRYPVIASGLIQSILAYVLLRDRGLWVATVAAMTTVPLTIALFFTTTANWFCVPLVLIVIFLLSPRCRTFLWRLETVGALIATIFLFRQLTGVVVAMGVLTFLFLDNRQRGTGRNLLSYAILATIAGGLVVYAAGRSDGIGWLIFVIWPLMIVAIALFKSQIDDAQTFGIVARLSIGAVVAALPLLLYHVINGSLLDWVSNSIFDAVQLSNIASHRDIRFFDVGLGLSLVQVYQLENFTKVINGIFWTLLFSLPIIVGGWSVFIYGIQRKTTANVDALPVVSIFYGLVSIHYQSHYYLIFSLGLMILAAISLIGQSTPYRKVLTSALAPSLAVIALYYHAGQPIEGWFSARLSGIRTATVENSGFERASIRFVKSDYEVYSRTLAFIEANSDVGDWILAIPGNAELYFLSRRRNSLPYSMVCFGLLDTSTTNSALERLKLTRPKVVAYDPSVLCNSVHTERLMGWVRAEYSEVLVVGPFRLFRLREAVR